MSLCGGGFTSNALGCPSWRKAHAGVQGIKEINEESKQVKKLAGGQRGRAFKFVEENHTYPTNTAESGSMNVHLWRAPYPRT